MTTEDRRRRVMWAVVVATLGTLFVVLVPRGLPYDELSHWQNVMHIQHTWSLPVLGRDTDVSHEAVQAPLSYVYFALVTKIFYLVGIGEWGQFYAARFFALPWLWGACLLLERLVHRCLPRARPGQVRCAVVVALLNPMILGASASVQNDVPALCLGLAATLVCLSRRRWLPFEAGLLVGLALLTKITVWPVAVVGLMLVLKSRGLKGATLMTATATATFAWWLVRNLLVYGDATGASAIERVGITFPSLGWNGVPTVLHLTRAAVTFLWIPVEYYGNNISAGLVIETLVVIGTVLVLAGAWRSFRGSDRLALGTVAVLSVVSVTAWALTDVWIEGASFRIAYLALSGWAACCAVSCRSRATAAGLMAVTGSLLAWTLWAVVAG